MNAQTVAYGSVKINAQGQRKQTDVYATKFHF